MMIGNLRLFTTDPLGTISLETLMDDKQQLFCHQVVLNFLKKIFNYSIAQVYFSSQNKSEHVFLSGKSN
jgi:hypothetical protein